MWLHLKKNTVPADLVCKVLGTSIGFGYEIWIGASTKKQKYN